MAIAATKMDGELRRWSTLRRENLDGYGVEVMFTSMSGIRSHRNGIGTNAMMRLSCFNPQFFIGSKVGDTALEAEYGAMARRVRREMQIVIDALRALSIAIPREEMPQRDRLALDRLQELEEETDRAGTGNHQVDAFSTAELDDLIGRLRRLRRDDPESADNVLRRLNEEAAPMSA